MKCPYCGVEVSASEFAEHRQICPKTLMSELNFPYSFRDYDIGLFSEAYKKCKTVECKRQVRAAYRSFEGGRWWKTIDNLHIFLASLDRDEIEKFKRTFPNLIKAVEEFALIEEVSMMWI